MRGAPLRRILAPGPTGPEDALTPPPPGFEEIQRQELSRLFGLVTRARLVLIPVFLLFFGWVAFADPVPWRRALLGLFLPAASLFFLLEWRRFRREGFTPGAIERNLVLAVTGQLVLSAATGGVDSPFMPLAVVLAIPAGLFASRRFGYVLLAVQIAGILGMATAASRGWVPGLGLAALGGGASGHGAGLVWADALFLSVFAAVARGVGRVARKTFDAMLRRSLGAQEDALRSHVERTEELTALSAEIAHELKNPLASVKGLSGLLEPALADAKAAERLAVLRREVERMQGILDEFLNFSRPLVPLALGRVDLAALAREVAALHEGLAHERGVQLEVRAAPAPARCDPRKVKQLLINLVQNALEASPAGARVELETASLGGQARAVVLDRGRGLDPALGDRLFEAGVTTKPRGSGLGLPIARQLARQHGGDLALRARDGGGTVAELALPAAPDGARGEA